MKTLWAGTEPGFSVQMLDSLPPASISDPVSAPAAEVEYLAAPRRNTVDLVSTMFAPTPLPGKSAPGPGVGGPAQLSLVSTASLRSATEVLGFETLQAISSALAHEVRGPLRWVTSFSELLGQEQGPALDQAGRDYLHRIRSATVRLDEVMRDLQKFVAAGLQEPRQQTVSLEAAACAVLGNLSCEISAKDARVTLQRPLPAVKGDSDWVQECITHLLDNALKFVAPGATPAVRISAESRPGLVRLWVEDHGPGIPMIHQERIFGLFKRLSNDFPGTGAGLALTRQACERMGGRAGVESESGQGSRFWIELPDAG